MPRILIHRTPTHYVLGVPAPIGTYALGAETTLLDAVATVIRTGWAFDAAELAAAFGVDRAEIQATLTTLRHQGRAYRWGGGSLWLPGKAPPYRGAEADPVG